MYTRKNSPLSWKPTQMPSIYKIFYTKIEIAVNPSLRIFCSQLLRKSEEHAYVENKTKINLK